MEFSAYLIFVFFTASMNRLTFGKERERAMLFPDYYFLVERCLVNHTIEEKHVRNLDECELLCYQNDNCVSLNYKKDSETIPKNNEPVHICKLNDATHLKYDGDLTTDANFYYRGSKNACDKNPSCQNNATCQSGFTLKGYRCVCPSGLKGEHCGEDINECKTPGKCHANATCKNTHGSYLCTCKPGYTGNGQNCTDVDECKGNHSCHESANCTNIIGSHECQCHSGYTGNGHNCTDIDECSEAHGNQRKECHRRASCINTQGSFNCSCDPEYTGNGFSCKADSCHSYKNLSDYSRKSNYITPDDPPATPLSDVQLPEGWYRFVGAAGTKMSTTRVPAFRCGTSFSGWLDGSHPTVEDDKVLRNVCFSKKSDSGCKSSILISVINCGSYFIYELLKSPGNSRYCATD